MSAAEIGRRRGTSQAISARLGGSLFELIALGSNVTVLSLRGFCTLLVLGELAFNTFALFRPRRTLLL